MLVVYIRVFQLVFVLDLDVEMEVWNMDGDGIP